MDGATETNCPKLHSAPHSARFIRPPGVWPGFCGVFSIRWNCPLRFCGLLKVAALLGVIYRQILRIWKRHRSEGILGLKRIVMRVTTSRTTQCHGVKRLLIPSVTFSRADSTWQIFVCGGIGIDDGIGLGQTYGLSHFRIPDDRFLRA